MIVRHDITADTYAPLPITDEALRRLQEAFRDHAPHLELDLGYTDTGVPFLTVTGPADGFDDAPPCITRNDRGWQMHRSGNGPLCEFVTAQEVAEFLGSGSDVRPLQWPLPATPVTPFSRTFFFAMIMAAGRETGEPRGPVAVKASAMLCVALALTAFSADAARLELPRVPHYQNPLPSPPFVPIKPPHYTEPSDQGKTAGNTGNNQSESSRTLWERTTADPNAFFTAVFTAVLAASTIGLWIVTWLSSKRQSRDMQASINATEKAATAAQTSGDAAVLQAKILRSTQVANVTLTSPGTAILQDLGGAPRGIRFWINLANNGQSGTRNMFGQVAGRAISDISEFSYTFPDTDLIPMVIGRGGTIEAGHIEFDASTVLKVIANNIHLFMFGWHEYDDIFSPDTPRHRIEYCFKVRINGELVKEHFAVFFDAHGIHNRHYDIPRQPPTAT